jgi:mannose-6-phosphate isomerase-like protein (cupin superfamily)
MPTFAAPFAVQSGEGMALETPTGGTVTVKADTRSTNGSLTVLELLLGPKEGPALHTHRREDELWYVIEGDFRFKAGDAMLRASSGGMAFGPRGVPHDYPPEAAYQAAATSSPGCGVTDGRRERSPRAGRSVLGWDRRGGDRG